MRLQCSFGEQLRAGRPLHSQCAFQNIRSVKTVRSQSHRALQVQALAARPGVPKGRQGGRSLDVGGIAKEEQSQGPSKSAPAKPNPTDSPKSVPAKPGRSLDVGGVAKEEANQSSQNGNSLQRPPQRGGPQRPERPVSRGSNTSAQRPSAPGQRSSSGSGQRNGSYQQQSSQQNRPSRPQSFPPARQQASAPSPQQSGSVMSRKREAALESPRTDKTEGIVMNEAIRYPEVRVLDEKKEGLGVMSTSEALKMAMEQDVDLILINPDAQPPLVRLAPLSKLKYEQKQKEKDQRKKQRESRQDVKELRFRPNTEEHDYNVRLNHAKRHLSKGDKVKLTMRFKGREMEYQNLGREMFTRFLDELGDAATVQSSPKMAGNQMTLLLGPKSVK